MASPISVSLPAALTRTLRAIALETHVSRSALIRAALEDYLFRFQFQKTRERLVAKARAKGLFTDEDVYRRLK